MSWTEEIRDPQIHKLKSWPKLFWAAHQGIKTHELRKNDRDYRIGDCLILQEYDPTTETYTGAEQWMEITYITSAENKCALSDQGLNENYCILSVRKWDGS